MKSKKKKLKQTKFNFLCFLLILTIFPFFINAEKNYICTTKKQSGLSNLGGEHKEILKYLGLEKFQIKFSQSRNEIFENESKLLKLNDLYIPKISHFIELIIIKPLNNLEVLNCTWLHSIKKNKINDNSFNCVESNNETLFSFDSNLNFVYSSRFNNFGELRQNSKVYHSLFGDCKKTFKNN